MGSKDLASAIDDEDSMFADKKPQDLDEDGDTDGQQSPLDFEFKVFITQQINACNTYHRTFF